MSAHFKVFDNQGTVYDQYTKSVFVGGIKVSAFKRTRTEDWWVEADMRDDDNKFPPIGPFQTAEVAWATLQLIKD